MQLGLLARYAATLAKGEVRDVARVAAIKSILLGTAALFVLIALMMCVFGFFLLLRTEVGEIVAAFVIAGICLALAIILLLVSLLVKRKQTAKASMADAQKIAGLAGKELKNVTPYLALIAFALGFFRGQK